MHKLKKQNVFINDLRAGEKLLWEGRPRQGVFLVREDFLLIPFNLVWGGFSYFWLWSAWQGYASGNGSLIFVAFGVPFALVGTYGIILRFFWEARRRRETYYAVTSERVLFREMYHDDRLISLERYSLPELVVSRIGKYTTLEFGPKVWEKRNRVDPPTFQQILDGDQVIRLISPTRPKTT